MKRFVTDAQDELSHAFSQSMLWAVTGTNDITVAAAIDDGKLGETDFAKCISETEIQKAAQIVDTQERRHFMYRRSFQRAFLRDVLKWPGSLNQIALEHQQDSPPKCSDFPQLHLSFSSSGTVFLASTSDRCLVGVDLEKMRPVENVAALATRFFTAQEAKVIESLPVADRDLVFLKIWTAKEAGLKAVGRGIESGLNNVVVSIEGNFYSIDFKEKNESQRDWRLEYLNFLPEHVVAVVHRVDK